MAAGEFDFLEIHWRWKYEKKMKYGIDAGMMFLMVTLMARSFTGGSICRFYPDVSTSGHALADVYVAAAHYSLQLLNAVRKKR